MVPPMDSGRVVAGRYRLVTPLGSGGMGTVWLALDGVLHRQVAVKEVYPPPGVSESERELLRDRTFREARTAARLSHPNVVTIYDVVEDGNQPWIVMELVRARSLRDMVQEDGPLTPEHAAKIGLQVLAALRAAHALGIMHRDVKPGNVLIETDGRAVLADFGIARAEDSPNTTTTGVLVGSPSYIAPERARGERGGPESDLWSLGATLYAAVEGRPPYERAGALATLTAVVTEDPDPPRRCAALWPVISELLRREPGQRLGAAAAEQGLRLVAGARNASATVPLPAVTEPADPGEVGVDQAHPGDTLERAEHTRAFHPRATPPDAEPVVPDADARPGIPGRPPESVAPEAESAAAEAEAEPVVPDLEAEPAAELMVPVLEADPVVSEAGADPVVPEAEADPVVPEARAEPVVPDLEAEPAVPEAEAEPVVPEAEAEPVVPDLEAEPAAELMVPDLEAEPVVPEAEAEPVVSEAEAEPVGPEAAAEPDAPPHPAEASAPPASDVIDGDSDGDSVATPPSGFPVHLDDAPSSASTALTAGADPDKPTPSALPPADSARRLAHPGTDEDEPRPDQADELAPEPSPPSPPELQPAQAQATIVTPPPAWPPPARSWPAAAPAPTPAPPTPAAPPAPAPPGATTPMAHRGRPNDPNGAPVRFHWPSGAGDGRVSQQRRQLTWMIAAAAALIVVAGVLIRLNVPGHHTAQAAANPGHSASGGAASNSAAASARRSPARSTSLRPTGQPASQPGAGGQVAMPAGYHRYQDPTGFSIAVPNGWQISHQGHYVYVTPPSGAMFLLIDQSSHPQPNPLADWQQQEANRTGTYPGYHRILLKAINYPQAERAADWEFTYNRQGVRTQVLNRNVLANSTHAYALYWSTPQSEWAQNFHIFENFAQTFQPAQP